jgi:hypothetical protein
MKTTFLKNTTLSLITFLLFTGSIPDSTEQRAVRILRKYVLNEAQWAMQQEPMTVTATTCPRSAGTKHDFYSEGDYWWPDSTNLNGPYIQRDGMTNPENFVAHRLAMIRFSRIVGSLTSAYKITSDQKYVKQAIRHIYAWFVDPDTRMNPSLLYAQAIQGRVTGRGIGIIDTIHLMEVAQAIRVIERNEAADKQTVAEAKKWFDEYINWLTTHLYGKDEMNAKNNHGTCWVMQVSAFAKLTGNQKTIEFCKERYKNVLLPDQMAHDGSFPLELKRTKPYGYSLFNLDAMAMICQILSNQHENLWKYQTADGKSVEKGISYLFPFVKDKGKWPLKPDVMYWNDWPVAHPFLIFGANALEQNAWFSTWAKLDHAPKVEEVVRNLPIRNPLIWLP